VGDADRHVAVHELGVVHVDESDGLPGVGLVGSNGAERHAKVLELADGRREIYWRDLPGRSNGRSSPRPRRIAGLAPSYFWSQAMCGRYAITLPPEAVRAFFAFAETPSFPPRYNIAPTQPIPVVVAAPRSGAALAISS
jgi:hypothetical protein